MRRVSDRRPAPKRSSRVLASVAGWAALLLVATGCGSDLSSAQRPHRLAALLPCTEEDKPTNFTAYSLGPEFDDLALTRKIRNCTQPLPNGPPRARVNMVSYLYGKCRWLRDTSSDGTSCSVPLEVQTWPRCERDPSDYTVSHHNPVKRRLTVRGVPAQLYEDGLRLEIYAGESSVIVFGTNRDRVLAAGRALTKAPARPSDPVRDGDAGHPLPPPPPGPIPCE